MPDWSKSMQQTFEYYTVDPGTWKDVKKLTTVKTCTITRDLEADTLGSASIDIEEDIGETYVRVYLITIQNGVQEKFPLGTFLVQTSPSSFDGKNKVIAADAYSPLLELKEKLPPIGYYVPEGVNIMDQVYRIVRENVRAPVSKPSCSKTLFSDFVSDTQENWITYITSLMLNANYILELDETGRILFSPKQDVAALQPVTTFNDDNSSILYPDIDMEQDLYGIPNVVEVVYSTENRVYVIKAKNNDPDSPVSIVNRGREIPYRETDPSIMGTPTIPQLQEYAGRLLKELSSIERVISYTHGYYPVRIGDCVRLNYTRAGINNVKAKVISQNISCEPGCPVTETAVYTTKLCGVIDYVTVE